MGLVLRPYQERGIADTRDAFRRGAKRVLYVAPTGSGKTVLAAFIIQSALELGNRVMFAAGRTELIDQTVATLATAGVTDVRIIQAARDAGREDAPVVVGSVQTLSAPRWRGRMPRVQLIVIDEAHHCAADQYACIALEQPEARALGLSATPERADGKPLGDVFDALVTGPSVRILIQFDRLVPCTVLHGPATLGPNELARTPLETYQRFAAGQRAGIYCRDIAHAKAELEVFRAAGIASDLVTGAMAAGRRRDVLDQWRAGAILVVISVGCLTEGFDLPALGVAILARRFNHVGQYLQVVGRTLRPFPGKSRALVVDLTNAALEHGPPDLEREYSLDGTAISKPARDSFGSCKECGAMFLYGPRQCPHCGAEIPTRPLPPPQAIGAELQELAPAKPRSEYVVKIVSKYRGVCAKCGGPYSRGDAIWWATVAKKARHQRCPSATELRT